MKKLLIAGAALLTMTASATAAKPKYFVQYKAADPFVIAPDRAYLLYRSNVVDKLKSDILFVRDLTPAEIEQVKAAEAKAKAKDEASRLAQINMNRQARSLPPLTALPPAPAGKRPPPPMLARVKGGVPNVMTVSGRKPLVKGEAENVYLVQVPAGTYLLAGTSPSGMVGGTCMCMGSVRFEARAGQVTDLGHVLAAPENAVGEVPEFKGIALDAQIKPAPWVLGIRPATVATSRPPQLANLTVVPASYTPAGKFPNFFGMMVNRLPAIPDVLTYEGDRPMPDAHGGR